jgi:hypothetical protein
VCLGACLLPAFFIILKPPKQLYALGHMHEFLKVVIRIAEINEREEEVDSPDTSQCTNDIALSMVESEMVNGLQDPIMTAKWKSLNFPWTKFFKQPKYLLYLIVLTILYGYSFMVTYDVHESIDPNQSHSIQLPFIGKNYFG